LLLATKQQPPPSIIEALRAGANLIGENRVQEMVAKADGLAEPNGPAHETHLIGPLQSNKVNAALRHAGCIQTIASVALAELVSRRAEERGLVQPVMVQVNVSGEPTKAGVAPEQAFELALQVASQPGLSLQGLMTVGLLSDDAAAVSAGYDLLRRLRDRVLASGRPGTSGATELSMGMSRDLELAVDRGATMVRLGTAVFGSRSM
jgi:pyridoxal phosphate enzyme (YggS family)